ncbi:MAG: hypothetical protein HQL79_08905 [Magnetococcales bacterium]|nr:hypothetical protein [Magnetococcales bacterium]
MNTFDNVQHIVRHFRQIILWPLQLIALPEDEPRSQWQIFASLCTDSPWERLDNEGDRESDAKQDIRYKEFTVFHPYVRRFLYGENFGPWTHTPQDPPGNAAIKIFYRTDVAALRVVPRVGLPSVLFQVEKINLIFFDDTNIVFLMCELSGDNLPLTTVHELLYRFGRAYPTGWNEEGLGIHNVTAAEWLGTSGEILASSDFSDRQKYLKSVRNNRVPLTAAHWTFLLHPLVFAVSKEIGQLRFHLIENHHMPKIAYLAIDNPRSLTREQWLRLGMADSLHPDEPLPKYDPEITHFETRFCFDRYWSDTETGPNCRFLCHGRTMFLVGDAQEPYFIDKQRGMLAQFQHHYFTVFLIAHLYRASLLNFSEQLVDAIHDLDVRNSQSIRIFRQRIHMCFEAFLRFTHRYWFHEVSERNDVQSLFLLFGKNLGNKGLYQEIKEELRDMSHYLDNDMQRRQSKTVTQLTVVTAFTLIGTLTTGFLGMNLIDEAHSPLFVRFFYFFITTLASAAVLMIALVLSQRLWDVMEIVSDVQKPLSARFRLVLSMIKNK